MIEAKDIRRLVISHERAMDALNREKPREAAKVLCETFKWLLDDKSSFWNDVRDATKSLSKHRDEEKAILRNLAQLVEDEGSAFRRLNIKASKTRPIIESVFGGIRLNVGQGLKIVPNEESLGYLRDRLQAATDLICKQTGRRLDRVRDWLWSWKGAMAMAGVTIIGVDVAVMIHSGGMSWTSVKVGVNVATGHIEDIIDLLGS